MKAVARDLQLIDHTYVRRWVRAYQKSGKAGLDGRRGQRGGINLGKARSQSPELKIKWLEAEVALLKKIMAWERGCARRSSYSPLSKS